MTRDQIATIKWYRRNKNLINELAPDELTALKDHLGGYYGFIFNQQQLKRHKIASGVKISKWVEYKREVKRITKLQPTELLENSDKPRAKHQKDFWSKDLFILDHKVSIWYGYQNNIAPEIIGDITNLRWITAYENSVKGAKCVFD